MATIREGQSGLALFAAELAAAREAAGLSQGDLGGRINYSSSQVAMVESRKRVPTADFAQRCDQAFGTPGTFARLQQHARTTPLPSWFRPWAEIEAAATQLRMFEHSIIPGLLQTEDYARAVLSGRPGISADDVEELVVARMSRQAVLDKDSPPMLWAVIDEGAVHRQVTDPKVMHDQLARLEELSRRPNIHLQVVPYGAGVHNALLGAFAIAEVDDVTRIGYLESVLDGYIVESGSVVASLLLAFEAVRSETLSRSASRDFITNRADQI
jgi:transcriptional regulator with XRE-family HTH domain